LQRQWAIAAERAAKIEVRRDSWYRLSRSSLRAAGIDLSSPGRLRLYADGKQVPVRISRGSLEFYGLARDTPSTDTRTYWLIRGPSSGLRIPVVAEPAEDELVLASSFPFTLERKYRTIYSTLQNGELQNYFGSMIYAKPMTLDVATRDLAQPTGSLELVVQGLSKRSHRIEVALNGRQLGQVAFGGQANVSKRFRLEGRLVRRYEPTDVDRRRRRCRRQLHRHGAAPYPRGYPPSETSCASRWLRPAARDGLQPTERDARGHHAPGFAQAPAADDAACARGSRR
jgi:hypothetical protein